MARPITSHRTVVAVATTVLILVACGGGSGFGGDGGGGGDQAEGGMELELMAYTSSPAEDAELQGIIDAYNEQSDNDATLNIVPEYDTTLQAALAGGDPPDVFYLNDQRLPDLVEAGALAPAEGQVENDDDFYPSLRDAFTYDGTFWCPPKDFSTLALQYDPDALAAAGIDPPTTWDELARAAEALTTPDRVGLVIGAEYPRWGAFIFGAGGSVTTEDYAEMTIDSAEVRTALEFLRDLHADGFARTASELDAGWPGEAYAQGKAAMTIEGNWIIGFLRNDFPDREWAVAELPSGPAGPATMAFTVCYAVSANAANPDASWDLVNFLVGAEQQLEYTRQFPVMPSRQSITEEWLAANADLEPFIAGADYAHPFQFAPGFQGVLDTLNDGIQGMPPGPGRSTT
ncbi:MAG: ABC transporter substrate-binding protein [Acidimicrobiales bacterium]